MSHYTSELQYDRTFGHTFFQSAIDLSLMGKAQWKVSANVTPNYAEAKRLYLAAIADAEAGIADIEKNPDWLRECSGLISHMRTQISQWKGEIHSMP